MPFARRAIAQKESGTPPVGNDFVMIVTTTGVDESFTIPCRDVGVFNAVVDWGDGSGTDDITAYNDADLAHVYALADTYEITISGDFPNIYFNNGGDKLVVDSVILGNVGWEDFKYAFYGCSNIDSVGSGDLSSVTNFALAWSGCSSMTSFPAISLASGTTFQSAWLDCSAMVSFGATALGSGSYKETWSGCSSMTSFPAISLAAGTIFQSAWFGCSAMVSFGATALGSGSYYKAWYGCSSMTSFPAISLAAGTLFSFAWFDCSAMTSFGANLFDSCSATVFTNAFFNCALDETSVDNILVSIDTAGQSNGTLDIDGGTSSPPSATGLAAKSSLEGKGWTVTTN